jgi:LysM repeat protein
VGGDWFRGAASPTSQADTAAVDVAPRGPRIEPGDTACSFAGRYGVQPAALLEVNELEVAPDGPLPPDGELVLPDDRPARYRVRQGDTLTSLGRHFGVSVRTLARHNDLDDANWLKVDAWLEIPAGARTACPPNIEQSIASRVSAPRPSAPAAVDSESREEALAHAMTAIRGAEARYDAADFPGALALVGVARYVLPPLASDAEVDALASQARWVAGLALVGLGRSEEALTEFRAALRLDPSLAESPALSPKVAALLEADRVH